MSKACMNWHEILRRSKAFYGLFEIRGVTIESEKYIVLIELREEVPTMSAQSESRIYEDSFLFLFSREEARDGFIQENGRVEVGHVFYWFLSKTIRI